MNWRSATYDLTNRTRLKHVISSIYISIVNSTDFTMKISFHEICFKQKYHCNTSILHGRAVYCSTNVLQDNYGQTKNCTICILVQLDADWAAVSPRRYPHSSSCSTKIELTFYNILANQFSSLLHKNAFDLWAYYRPLLQFNKCNGFQVAVLIYFWFQHNKNKYFKT